MFLVCHCFSGLDFSFEKHANGMETEIMHYRTFALVHLRYRVVSVILQHGLCLT